VARKVKCQWCEIKDEKEKMVKEHSKGYIHIECLPKYIKDKEMKQKEREKKDKLAAKIAEVYELESIQLIPHQIWPYIEDIRNDSNLFGKLGKNYKAGIPYEGIALTFEYCKEKIREVRRTKEFKNFQMEIRYGLAIIKNNIVDAKNDYEYKIRIQKSLDEAKSIEHVSGIEQASQELKYIKYEDEDDITKFLD